MQSSYRDIPAERSRQRGRPLPVLGSSLISLVRDCTSTLWRRKRIHDFRPVRPLPGFSSALLPQTEKSRKPQSAPSERLLLPRVAQSTQVYRQELFFLI